ncbi:MAG: hypothetical protein ABSH21_08435 [Verrucomicrobiia bacterium]|jgi:uncharacterized repeat protein (TIGR01451 family)
MKKAERNPKVNEMRIKKHKIMRMAVLPWWMLLAGLIFIHVDNGFAFKPWRNGVWAVAGTAPADCESHQSITEDAITEFLSDTFSVAKPSQSMLDAMKEIVNANGRTDYLHISDEEYHFDAESFPKGQELLISEFQSIQASMLSNDVEGARTTLGRALHTLQDFYSHSTWVELGNTAPNPDLGRPGHVISDVAGPTEVTCWGCTQCDVNCSSNLASSLLTSGYFSVDPWATKTPGKCSHGGPGDYTADLPATGGVNKDTTDCNISPHGAMYHHTAATVAKLATKQFLGDINAVLEISQMKQLLGFGPTLTICIDTTGSMGDIIADVQQQSIAIVEARLGTADEPSQFVLAPFNDPDVGPVFVTSNPSDFENAIMALGADGGGDCPELSMSGALQGLAASGTGGELFLFTDADAKDSDLADDVSNLAASKHIKIYPFIFGSCSEGDDFSGSSSLGAVTAHSNVQNSPKIKSDAHRAAAVTVDSTYAQIANATGGQMFSLDRTEDTNITALADVMVQGNAVTLLSVHDTLAGADMIYTIPVDSLLTQLTFSLSGNDASVIVKRPDGSVLQPTDGGVSYQSLSSGTLITITPPVAGNWMVTVSGTGDFSLVVSGESSLNLSSFAFVVAGGPAVHSGFFPIDGLPVAGQTNTVNAALTVGFASAQFQLRSPAGAVLQSMAMVQGSGLASNEFLGTVVPPATPFLAYVTGQDVHGSSYQRVLPAAITPQAVTVTAPADQKLQPGQITTYIFQVQNTGGPDTFHFTVSDDKGYVLTNSITPSDFDLGTNATTAVSVSLQPPADASAGISDTLTATVKGDTGSRNFAVLSSIVAPSFADVGITQTVSAPVIILGGDLTYTVTVTNRGPSAATAVTLTNVLPSTVTISSVIPSQGTYDIYDNNIVVCNLGDLPSGASASETITVNPTQLGQTCNSSAVTANTADPSPDDNAVTTCSYVNQRFHDMAVTTIIVPKTINLTAAKSSQTKTISVQIQNRSPQSEVISNATVLANLVTLTVQSLSAGCSNLTPTLVPPRALPITLKSNAKLTVMFNVRFSTVCVPDPLPTTKGNPHPDYRYIATIHHEAIDGDLDMHSADDTCPRGPLPGGFDPNPNGKIKDLGCGGKNPNGTLGADLLTDVVVK